MSLTLILENEGSSHGALAGGSDQVNLTLIFRSWEFYIDMVPLLVVPTW